MNAEDDALEDFGGVIWYGLFWLGALWFHKAILTGKQRGHRVMASEAAAGGRRPGGMARSAHVERADGNIGVVEALDVAIQDVAGLAGHDAGAVCGLDGFGRDDL